MNLDIPTWRTGLRVDLLAISCFLRSDNTVKTVKTFRFIGGRLQGPLIRPLPEVGGVGFRNTVKTSKHKKRPENVSILIRVAT